VSLLLALLVQAAEGRQAIGVHGSWGAFRDRAPARCYAVSTPRSRGGDTAAFASVATWPGTGARNQLHVRLSRQRSPRARVTLSVGERRFELMAGPRDAWSPDARTDRAIVASLRGGRSMSVESVDARGRPFADTYQLGGAATAIDAAAVACAG
jgi:hypothetical protein